MIVSCPECNSRFKVSADALGVDGRKVQCSDCRHVWFAHADESFAEADDDFSQEQDDSEDGGGDSDEIDFAALMDAEDAPSASGEGDEVSEGAEGAVFEPEDSDGQSAGGQESSDDAGGGRSQNEAEDIPDAVKPDSSETAFVVGAAPPPSMRAVMAGYGAAGGVFIALLLLFILLQGPIVRSWPPAQAVYALLGRSSIIAGEGLEFDRMEAYEDGHDLVVSGQIINMTKEGRNVPLIEVALTSQYDEKMGLWYIEPPKTHVGPEETIAFEGRMQRHEVPGVRGQAGAVDVRFALRIKTDAEGGGSTHVLAEGDPSHPSGGEAPSEYPPHASSPPHQEPSQSSHGEGHGRPPALHTDDPADHTSGHH